MTIPNEHVQNYHQEMANCHWSRFSWHIMSVFHCLYRILRADNKFRFWCVWKMFLGHGPCNENFLSGYVIAPDAKNIEYSRRLVDNFWLRNVRACLPFQKLGRHAPRFQKVQKTSGKEKWRNPFSVLPLWKHVVEKLRGKVQNIEEITSHINHKTRVYVINRRVCTSLF